MTMLSAHDFLDVGRLMEAEAAVRSALLQNCDDHRLWFEYGRILDRRGDRERALLSFREAVEKDPGSVPYTLHFAHAIVARHGTYRWSAKGYCDEPGFSQRNAESNLAELFNVGHDLFEIGYFNEAEQCYRAASEANCGFFHPIYWIASVQLLRGDFRNAADSLRLWYEKSLIYNNQTFCLWWGENIPDKTLCVYHEHGLGDIVQFTRFLPIAAQRCGRLVFVVPGTLRKIFQDIPGVELVNEVPNHFDAACSLFLLPHAVGIDLETVSASVPYLRAEPERVAYWGARLPPGGLRIGIAWQGNPDSSMEPGRSIPLARLAPLARVPGVSLISLQMNHGLEQLEHLPEGMTVTTLGPDFNAGPDNVVDTAAVMKNLDLVISTDTSVPHIAGALGCPVWVLLRKVPDWRWMLDREDSPWYPTMRLFRQETLDDWNGVVARVAAELSRLVAERGDAERCGR